MHCFECRAEFDEMNESQPVCPGCGAVPRNCGESSEICALMEDAASFSVERADLEEAQGDYLEELEPVERLRTPVDFQEAAGDAEALLEATGFLTFNTSNGFRFFKTPTELQM